VYRHDALLNEHDDPRSEYDQIVFFHCLYLYHKSPDSGERPCKSRTWERRFDATLRAGGGHRHDALLNEHDDPVDVLEKVFDRYPSFDQMVFFNRLHLYHKSPDSGERQCKSRTWERPFDATLRAGGGYRHDALLNEHDDPVDVLKKVFDRYLLVPGVVFRVSGLGWTGVPRS